ncbi:hypothetical protein [Streptomyces sp. NPDC007355]|uniref:hypothetical protein n=1 Tax=Streptomyces sp. NPDC007355 TaxID=3364778 RepID=UPI0036D1458C
MELDAVKRDNRWRLGLAQAGAAMCRQVQVSSEALLVICTSDEEGSRSERLIIGSIDRATENSETIFRHHGSA